MRALLSRVTRQGIAHLMVLLGAALVAAGAALVYVPAGLVVGGIVLAAWALLIFDVEPPK